MTKQSISIPGGNRVRELRQQAGLSQAQLAERVGTHFTTIYKLETSRRRLTEEWIMKLSGALGVPPATLLGSSDGRGSVRMIPVIGEISAGSWQEAITSPIEWIPIPEGGGGANTFALRPSGDSMNLIVSEGAFVVVDPDQRELQDARLYAVMNNAGEATFKRFRNPPPRLEPVSSNPEHRPIPLGQEPFTVVGRVISYMALL